MNALTQELVELLSLEKLEENIYRGISRNLVGKRVFGGQVLGQALMAASRTAPEGRAIHSLHAYFLLPGEHMPIQYEVDRVRDGGSFSMRRVTARQRDKIIFELTASFQTADTGPEHQFPMAQVAGPEGLVSEYAQRQAILPMLPAFLREKALAPRGLEFRRVQDVDILNPKPREGATQIWVKAMDALPDDPLMQRALLAHASDFNLLGTSLLPHGITFFQGNLQGASLDHALWFHRPFRIDDWLLYQMESPSASGARGFNLGGFYTRGGQRVASSAQEGLLRLRMGTRPT